MPIPERLNPTFAAAKPARQDHSDALEKARDRLIVALDVPDAGLCY